ncbi:MAG: dihydroneopterin aldolase family protein, partial [Thermoplasmatales archaeon]
MNDPAAPYFSCSEKERAIFESGVKLGAIYHQYIGIPV